jgi:hypothetical protein
MGIYAVLTHPLVNAHFMLHQVGFPYGLLDKWDIEEMGLRE